MEPVSADNLAFSSSIAADVWHPQKDDKSYEWWYFDALSDDGSEAVVIVFLDNFIYSPRYNRETASIKGNARCPAIAFTYFRDGKAVYKATSEYHYSDFHADEGSPECRIGNSTFRFERAPYGKRFVVSVDIELSGGRRLKAELEWLTVESDLMGRNFCYEESRHCWNMVAPRADVTGVITVCDHAGEQFESNHFRGTGYHDHNLDNRWLAKTVKDWHWGRAHFADCTVVFYRFREVGNDGASTRLLIVRDGEMEERIVTFDEQSYVRDKFGIRYPSQLHLVAEDGVRVHVRPAEIVDSSFYFLRFLSEVTLEIPGRAEHSTTGLTEFIAPRTLRYRWLNWIADVRTGKDGRPSFF